MSGAPMDLLLERADRLTRDMADMREAHVQPFRILTRSIDGLGREVAGFREEVAGLRREAGALASGQASLAMRGE